MKGKSQGTSSRAGIEQVARLARVSIASVSRVLSGHPHVSAELKARVEAAVKRLDYAPNRAASALRARSSRVVGVVIPDVNNPFFTAVLGGIESVLQQARYSLLLTNSGEDPKRERDNVKVLQAEGVAGIAFTPSGADTSAYRKAAGSGVVLVAIARVPAFPVDSVTVNGLEGTCQAVSHLIGLGHRRIALINGPEWSSSVQERQAGYERAFESSGIPAPSELIVHSDLRQKGGHDAMAELLTRRPPPTAVFVANNLMTLGALTAIHERSLRIPGDIAMIGFDDLPWATALEPPLTAVALPTEALGVTAAQLLLERIGDPSRPVRRVTLATQLILRESSGGRLVGNVSRKRTYQD